MVVSRAMVRALTWLTLFWCQISPEVTSAQSTASLPGSEHFECPSEWELHGRFCYRFFNIHHSWNKAAELCRRYGSDLVMIDTYRQNNLTWSLAADNLEPSLPPSASAPSAVVGPFGPVAPGSGAVGGSHYWLGYRTLDDLSTNSLESAAGTLDSQYIGYWALGNPRAELGECVRARMIESDQSWQLSTCEQLLPFMCRATACLAGEFHCANGKCINGAFTCDSEDDCGDMSDESDCQDNKPCHVYQRSSSGAIESPGYPERYPANSHCRWTVEAPLGHKITVQFSAFETEKEFDTVQVMIGGATEEAAVNVMTLSGNLDLQSQLFTTASNFLIVKFRSDATVEKSGFRASWKSEPQTCGGHVVAPSSLATLTSPEYPQNYPGGLECLYIISTQIGRIVTIEVEELDLEPGNDYLRVRDGSGAQDTQLAWLTGSGVPATSRSISSTGHLLYVYTRTDLADSRRGFRLNYRTGCDSTIIADNGTIYSPGFQAPTKQYPTNVRCDVLVQRGDGLAAPISLKFTHLELDRSDAVQVYDGIDVDSLQLHAGAGFTGSETPRLTLTAQSGSMLVRFISDPLKTARGFQAVFSSDCPELNPGAGAIGSSRDAIFGTRVTFTCPYGQQFATGKAAIVTECLPGGQWTVTYIPKCQEVYCGPVPQIDNGFAIGATNVTYLGQATYQCYAGFAFPSGQPLEKIQCSEEGNWGKLPVCLASQCPALSEAKFAKKMVLNGGGRSYGTIVRYECDPGYVRSGMPVLFCMSNGTWSGEVPSCSRIKCPSLPEIDNGHILDPAEEYYYGDEASVQCYGGFRLQGSAVITCGPDQEFINQPRCQDINECAAAKCELGSTVCSNTAGSYHCECMEGHRPNLQCRPIDELGLTSGAISPENIHVSGTESGYDKNLVRVNAEGGWCGASSGARDNWVMVDLSAPTVIHGFRIQPVSRPDNDVAFAKSLRLFYTNNLTDVLHEYRTPSGAPVEFRTAGAGLSVISMPAPIEARYVRLTILDYEVAPCMRVELMGCVRHECVDIDECADNNGGCDQTCRNSVGSSSCECSEGYQLFTGNGTAAFPVAFSETGHRDGDIYRFNKTCVPRQCPSIEDPVNGVLVSTQETFHYGDIVAFHCSFGYVMRGASVLQCTSTGDWNGTVPSCQFASCDALVSKPGEGLLITVDDKESDAASEALTSGTVAFGTNVSVTCADNGKPGRQTLTAGFRQCVYDPRPGIRGAYWMSGAAPSCPRVDCGLPPSTPGSSYGTYQDTKYLSFFTFGCESTFTLAGRSSAGDKLVRCLASGVWDFGDLRCEGPVCTDPGRPADGRQIASSYEQGSEVSFTCNKPGYIPFSSVPVKCVRQPECAVIKPLGISDGRIPADAINATTERANYESDKVRLGSSTGWCGLQDQAFTYVQVNLLSLHRVKAILLKGVVTNDVVGRPIEIRFFYKRSIDENYVVYFPNFNLTARDPGNYGELAMITLPESVEAQFVILGIVQYDRNPCLKFELMGCGVEEDSDGVVQSPLLGFDMGYSVCVDAEPPQFVNCPSDLIKVSKADNGKLLPVNFTEPLATDNSGMIVRTEVKPAGFEPPLHVFRDMMVEYLAFDFDGNVAICQMNISVPDDTPPKITCPKSYVIQLVESKPSYTVDFTQSLGSVEVFDDTNKLEDISIEFSPKSAEILLGNFSNVTVTATDKSGNSDSCYYQVAVKATPCVSWDVTAPANGQINCDSTNDNGLSCTASCNEGFRFTDGDLTKTITCSAGQPWTPSQSVPGCVSRDTQMAHYDVSSRIRYRSNGAVATECVSQYQDELEDFYSDLSAVLSARCSQAVNLNMDVRLLSGEARKVAENMVEMEHILRITPEVAQSTLYNLCGLNLGLIFELSVPSTSVVIETLLSVDAIGNRCPPLKALTSNVTRGYTCDQGEVLDSEPTGTNIPRCLHCPAGSFGKAQDRVCTACARGYYQHEARQGLCHQCPPGTYTHYEGSTSIKDCVPVCGFGTYSLSGLVPCLACPRNSYTGQPQPQGYTQCQQCPQAMFTHAEAASDVSLCRAKCQPGSYSATGLEPCHSCPRSFFQPIVGANTCFECPTGNTTVTEGATSPDQCIPVTCSADTCMNGGLCQMLGHEARCYCPAGFTGKRCETDINECLSSPCHNGATCVDRPQGYTCRCADGYSGVNCQVERSDCVEGACPARAMCMDLPGPDNYRCLCREGYTGPQCNITVNPCVEDGNPCSNNARCIVLQQGRFMCECEDGWQGSLCDINIDDCAEQPCLLDAKCTDLTHDFMCDCPKGFTGKRCEQKVDLCADQPCENGLCIDRFFTHECVCYDGWTGASCDVNINECAVTPMPCENGGTCIDELGAYSCSCVAGYTGKNCQHIVDYCASEPCRNGATCNNTLQGAQCTCRPGFVGLQCESEIDECTSSPCSAQGTERCEDVDNDFICHCRTGYSGELCQTNRDECASNPCLNDGVCTDGLDMYTCQCKPGWTGLRCESDIGSCDSSPCLNDANCVDLFQGFFCACPSGTDGARCEVTPERCIGSPCMNGGFCRDFGSGLNCSCPDDYLGVGCQHELDACEAGVCRNGATCMDVGAGYTCHCAPGYTGRHCDTDMSNCDPSSCPAGATCVDLVDDFYCRCPFNLTGEDCRKTITVDYELYFNDDTKSSSASLYAPFSLDNSTSLSIGMWVQFTSRLDIGTFFTLYSVSSLHEASDRRVLVQINSLGALVDLFPDREPVLLDFNSHIPVNDRQWHHLVVTWENTGRLQLITDLVVAATAQGYGEERSLPEFGYVTLGAPLLPEPSKMPQAKSGFHGKLARVNMWSRVLNIRTEIPRQVENCRRAAVLYEGLLLRWSGYSRLHGGVERRGPSSCGQTVCPPGYTEDCRSRARDKTVPRVDFCPGDLWIDAPNGSLAVSWDKPRFSDDTKIQSIVEISGYSPGQLFPWGSHHITYIARDAASNSAICSFTLHVLKEICPALDDPSGGSQQCSSWGPDGRFRHCTISCDPGLQFSEPVADFYVCGADGTWRPNPDRSVRLKYPSCAPAEKAQRVVRIRMNFPSSVFCNNAGKSVLNKRIREALQKLNKNWNFCINSIDGDDCQGLNVAVNCARASRRRRQVDSDGEYEAVVSLPVQSGVVTNPDTNQATDLQKLLETIILENDELDVRSQLPNVILDPASVQLGSEYFCPEGKVVVGEECVSCATGTSYDRDTASCVKCAIGTYQSELGQLGCVTCPPISGQPAVTATTGAQSVDQCKERCEPGHYYSEEEAGCVVCGYGHYQPDAGQFSCVACPLGQTTRTENSASQQECKAECGDGEQLWVDSTCRACARGTYRTRGLQPACVPCPEGRTTRAEGAVSAQSCVLPVCPPGQYLNRTAGDVCVECARGTYQPEPQQTSCIECPADTTTQQMGADNSNLCINPCNNPSSNERRCSVHAFCVIASPDGQHTDSTAVPSGSDSPSFQCRCKVGYRGDGYNCTDLCDGFCENSGVCSRHPHTGQPRCACIGSFTGGQCEEKSKFAYIAGGVSGFVVIAIICVLFIWMICARSNKKKQPDTVQKALTLPPDAASQVNFYYGAPTPYAESIAPSHHSAYAHYYDEEDDAWEMPNFYNDAYVKDNVVAGGNALHPAAKANSLARSNASIYGAPRQDDLYDRLRKHAYTGKKDKNDTTDDSDDQVR